MFWQHLIVTAFFLYSFYKIAQEIHETRQTQRQIRAAAQWPTTTGIILNSTLSLISTRIEKQQINVLYQYRVKDETYQNSRIAFGYHASNAEQFHDAIAQKLPEGTLISVHYNPENPHDSTLSIQESVQISHVQRTCQIWLLALSLVALGFYLIQSTPSITLHLPSANITNKF